MEMTAFVPSLVTALRIENSSGHSAEDFLRCLPLSQGPESETLQRYNSLRRPSLKEPKWFLKQRDTAILKEKYYGQELRRNRSSSSCTPTKKD